MLRHSLTAASNCGLPLQIAVHPGSSLLTVVGGLCPFLVLHVSSGPRPVRSSESVFNAPSQYGRTAGAGTASSVGL